MIETFTALHPSAIVMLVCYIMVELGFLRTMLDPDEGSNNKYFSVINSLSSIVLSTFIWLSGSWLLWAGVKVVSLPIEFATAEQWAGRSTREQMKKSPMWLQLMITTLFSALMMALFQFLR